MEITCPNCSFTRQVADEKIPSGSVFATCPKCKHRFRFKELEFTIEESPEPVTPEDPVGSSSEDPDGPMDAELIFTEVQSDGPTDPPLGDGPAQDGESTEGAYGFQAEARFGPHPDVEPPPWEQLNEYGFFSGLTQTVKRVMVYPVRFFSSMPVGTGLGKPLIFYLLMAGFQFACHTVWQMLGVVDPMTAASRHEALGIAAAGAAWIFFLIIGPILLAILLFIGTAIVHLLLLIFNASSAGFEGTFRALSYSSAPQVLAVIPFLGGWVALVWGLVLWFISLKHIHRTSYIRVTLALLPIIFIFLAGLAMQFFLAFKGQQLMY